MRKAIITAVLVLATQAAHADDKKKAKALYEEGLKRYNVAEYSEAIKAWKEAYLLSKRALLLFNIGQAYRLSGDCKQAMTFYDSYQREEPSPKNQDELDEALKLCKDAKPADKPVDKPAPPDKPLMVGDKPVPPVDKPADKPITPVVAQPMPDQPEEPIDQPTTTGGGLRKVGIVVGAVGVVMGGVGIYFALDAASTASELDGYMGEWGQEQVDLELKGQQSQTLGLALGIGGVVAIAAGGVMFAIGGPKSVETSSMSVIPTKGGAALGWGFKF